MPNVDPEQRSPKIQDGGRIMQWKPQEIIVNEKVKNNPVKLMFWRWLAWIYPDAVAFVSCIMPKSLLCEKNRTYYNKKQLLKREHMELLTEDLKKKFSKVGSQQNVEDPIFIAKYFLTFSSWAFYATAFDPRTDVFTGMCNCEEMQWGTVNLHDLESLGRRSGTKVRARFIFSLYAVE